MTYEQISDLLEKYWDGESSLDEERTLKRYFATGPVDERLRNVAPLFAALRAETRVELQRDPVVQFAPGPAVNWRRWAVAAAAATMLITAGWWWMTRPANPTEQPAVVETPAEAAPALNGPTAEPTAAIDTTMPQLEKPVIKRPNKRPVRLAVAAAAPVDPEAERAMEEIKAALALVSSKLNKGKREAAKNLHEFETIDKMIRKPGAS